MGHSGGETESLAEPQSLWFLPRFKCQLQALALPGDSHVANMQIIFHGD